MSTPVQRLVPRFLTIVAAFRATFAPVYRPKLQGDSKRRP